jgi:anthranilate phosphoribosyltransferase
MKHAQPARAEIKMRTALNLLGPLTNPAGARYQLIGASSERTARLVAETLAELGTERAFVVHGSDGLDEITTTGSTLVLEVSTGRVAEHVWQPRDFNTPRASLADLAAPAIDDNVRIARAVLGGESGPCRDIAVVNAAGALLAAGEATTPYLGVQMAERSIDSGAARECLDKLIDESNQETLPLTSA